MLYLHDELILMDELNVKICVECPMNTWFDVRKYTLTHGLVFNHFYNIRICKIVQKVFDIFMNVSCNFVVNHG